MSGNGMGGGLGWSPSSMADNWRAHPVQQGLAALIGGMLPGAGTAMTAGFRAYNNHQFDNAAQQVNQAGANLGNQAAQASFNAPLNGPLGLVTGMPGYTGAPSMGGYNPAGPTYANGYGFNANTSPTAGLLDFLGPDPNAQPPPFNLNPGGGPAREGGGGGLGGFGDATRGFGGMLPGGGFNGVMNGASGNMMTDFAAPTNGDWMQRIQTHFGSQGAGRTAARR